MKVACNQNPKGFSKISKIKVTEAEESHINSEYSENVKAEKEFFSTLQGKEKERGLAALHWKIKTKDEPEEEIDISS